MIKKYKNGNVHLDIKYELKTKYYVVGNGHEADMRELDKFYQHEMTNMDLYIQVIEGYPYILDYNKQLAYNMPHCSYEMFLESLGKGNKIILESLGKKESNRLFSLVD